MAQSSPPADRYTLEQVAEQARRQGDQLGRRAAARCIAWECLRERRA